MRYLELFLSWQDYGEKREKTMLLSSAPPPPSLFSGPSISDSKHPRYEIFTYTHIRNIYVLFQS